MQVYALLFENIPAHCDAFRSILGDLTERVKTDPVCITYEEYEQGDYRLFRFQSWCREEYNAETIDWARAFIALAVAEWVLRVKEPEVMEEMAADLMEAELLEEEWPSVLPFIHRLCLEQDFTESALHMSTRKAKVYRKVFDYFEDERQLNVLGFVRFRLQEHWNDLFELVETGLDDYLEDQQYQEFVDLLRYFVADQETKQEVVHVVPSVDKPFHLYDKQGNRIFLEQLDAILCVEEQRCREEDYLVSALVTLAPERIILHLGEDRLPLIQTVRSIFEARTVTCHSCSLCLSGRRILDGNKPTPL
ncbi:putative sporulation protein YtxC [Brevibacillus composti]|uniref:Sporulation protein YtxC n=1 Tax=Brevibacillus composti TaxID=2796470 RepID=A0A7T5EIW3_9BACL|nr:putative sporulation protein YtxC [Brevibacillus composti]QQE73370.1 putative sporulation protein YtxC [Brevibacillus composti]QQE73462.1 putative sporulation protein YtxC [Brevibacillus composti]QUO40451.1 putative sporulation protein YtxC [Brevibacillus composti]QUO40544.1 putative sporulation protein YtxC [Brevibacillus composti]